MHDIASNVCSTWRHPNGGRYYFDSNYARELIERYNATGDLEALNQLLDHVEPLAKSILEYRATTRYEAIDEILSRIRIKLWKSSRLYDPAKGTAFSFCAKVITSTAASIVGETWNRNERYCEIDEADSCTMPNDAASLEAITDIEYRVRQLKTPLRDRYELSAQRWFVESFIAAGFILKRHEAADAVMKVYGITHMRSRQLYDLTMISVRRELIGERRLSPVLPDSLRTTKIAALIRYAKLISADEFTRLATLLQGIAPSVVLTVRPRNLGAIRRGDPKAIRINLNLILYGAPTDRHLFVSIRPVNGFRCS
jgi:hypothetical protein